MRHHFFNAELLGTLLIYGSLGAIAWAIRGTSAWGGFDGALVPGFLFALLWYLSAKLRSVNEENPAFVMFPFAIAIAIGGMLGYGEYISWIRGFFLIDRNDLGLTLPISPFTGYLWLWICGCAWLGIAGVILGKILDMNQKNSVPKPHELLLRVREWMLFITFPLLFVGIGYLLLSSFPGLFYPLYSESFYTESTCPNCLDRVVPTNMTNVLFILWWAGALVYSAIRKDQTALTAGLLFGVGFGFLFALNAVWMVVAQLLSSTFDFWKVWELGSGFSAGLLIWVFQSRYLAGIEGGKVPQSSNEADERGKNETDEGGKNKADERGKKEISVLICNLFWFIGICCYGLSFHLGAHFGFYPYDIDQYSFPLHRIIIFIILLVIDIIICIILSRCRSMIITKTNRVNSATNVNMVNNVNTSLILKCIAIIGVFLFIIGEITIYPSEIFYVYPVYFLLGCVGFLLLRKNHDSNSSSSASAE